ncbi:putative regulatory protein, FmdB family [Desulfuromusa kysingii]|uniref:Putative regulatory protein, FmdB family n=1 Tax=Desulfuromusa kysingii TaxID=37625 RepID=A0A1H3YNN8_9BACT|nr:zinc ribbon domain-containing protein [Desulfuromusa kysingii]SEA13219.1 putative regulatory protein, FmdB family [Desulfuromusa kysingii]
MPLYEYQCEECGLNFEVRQKFTDAPIKVCGRCGGAVKKQISQTAFTLKGGGWYDQGYTHGESCHSSASKASSSACASCPKAVNS